MPFWRGVPPKSINTININSISAINVGFVTTLILVLFIIGIVIALAKVETQAPTAHTERMPESPLYLTVTTDLTLRLGNEAIGRDILPMALDAATKGARDTRVFLRADNSVFYGEVREVMNLLCKAGYLKVALVELEQPPIQINLDLSDKCQVTTDLTLWLGNDPVLPYGVKR
jgi:biopolymer transport protein ExbD